MKNNNLANKLIRKDLKHLPYSKLVTFLFGELNYRGEISEQERLSFEQKLQGTSIILTIHSEKDSIISSKNEKISELLKLKKMYDLTNTNAMKDELDHFKRKKKAYKERFQEKIKEVHSNDSNEIV